MTPLTLIRLVLASVLALITLGCAGQARQTTGGNTRNSSHASTRIAWDDSTLVLIQRRAGYGRMLRLPNRDILCAYGRQGKVRVRRSRDNGRTWEEEVLAASYDYGSAANPEMLLLENGWILLTYNERPADGVHHFTIMACTSKDQGASWADHRLVYEAGTGRRTGCWEPAQIQLPSGEIQLFFANEKPYPSTSEQEITLVRSHDNGAAWGPPHTISFRAGRRDGMPVPLLLAGGKGIVLAIEDNGLNGAFKPVMIHTSLKENWSQPFATGDSPRRRGALAQPLPASVYAGAPYIRQLATGETILSVQSGEGRATESVLDHSQMAVYIGDNEARDFTNKSVPFQVSADASGLWNSLFVKDASTLTAISGTTIKGVRGLWAIDGKVIRVHRDTGTGYATPK